ncbi:hypothetical protein NEAUS04_0142 [Nematocida ausubeli]|uniref:Phospholipid/glycerol acyltransferase domain-containing protein n=1 Tax=Nematocida ausubeli (strain ATCC PRA-371 / ERTm2) TaxID=1913371 RepID=A0A086J3J6_NEMA1|nr:uncharacterized protein NESG_00868 [Nematocida ausubeli]KAI5133762.1 hypothetical protein NEAUS06_0734 [Nematocida ausubeli]KAI5160768.1 hypothetical protein NEAUS04_0142 [Nematocida ausubeli]KFG26714.1 hypothetical protein NESG_00868 [Nematocida ausubeli]
MNRFGFIFTLCKMVMSLYLIACIFLLLLLQIITFPMVIINRKSMVWVMDWYNRHFASACLFLLRIGNKNAIEVQYINEKQRNKLEDRQESLLIISNHICAFDGTLLAMISKRFQMNPRFICKSELRWIPVIGWGMYLSDYLFIKRAWSIDCERIKKWCTKQSSGISLVIYPEGTRFTQSKQKESAEYTQKKGLSTLRNVLYPRTKGYNLCVNSLPSPPFSAILNVTMVYLVNGRREEPPSFLSCVSQRVPGIFKIIVERESITQDVKNAEYLVSKFKEKDLMISQYCSV